MTPSPARALLPYPGLRPFERYEADVFFGREAQVDAMVDRLARHRLLVVTMRSDFLGRCAEFDGLAEAVSDAKYLCPRLSRDQIRSAIEGPAEVFGGKVEPRLASSTTWAPIRISCR